jgi:N-acetylneuraminic acid mutarotase
MFNKFKKRIKSRSSNNKASSSLSSNTELQDSLLDDSLTDGKETLSKEVYEYDNSHDIWIRKANMLFAKANSALCAMGDKLYSFGGVTTNQDQFDIVECYDINENKWSYVCSMPAPFVAGCVVCHGDCFYVLGGRSGVGRFDNCFMFKPEKKEWHELNSMKTGR